MNRISSHGSPPNEADLRAAHARLDRRVRELDRRAILTPTEQRERSDLKKHKLALKDQLTRLLRPQG